MEEFDLSNAFIDLSQAYDIALDKIEKWVEVFFGMIPNMAVAILVVIGFTLLAKLFKRISLTIFGKIADSESLYKLFSIIVYIIVLSIGVFIALGVLKLEKTVTSLLAGLGVIGLALGFAFQEVASNFMAGIIILIRKPFHIGEVIKSNDYMGTVKKINLRTTEIESFQGQKILIPNKEVFQNAIINYSTKGRRRIDLPVGVSYGDDLRKVKKVTTEALQALPFIKDEEDVMVIFKGFGDSSINFDAKVWIDYPGDPGYLAALDEIVITVKEAFDHNDITIPFPIRTLDFGIKGGEKISDLINLREFNKPNSVNKKEIKS